MWKVLMGSGMNFRGWVYMLGILMRRKSWEHHTSMLVKLEIIHFDIEKIECCMQMVMMMVRKWIGREEMERKKNGKTWKLFLFTLSSMWSQFCVWVLVEIFSSSQQWRGWLSSSNVEGKTAIRNSAKESHNRTHRKHRTNGRNDFRICVHSSSAFFRFPFALHATAIATVTTPRAPLAFVVQPAGKNSRKRRNFFFRHKERQKYFTDALCVRSLLYFQFLGFPSPFWHSIFSFLTSFILMNNS